MDQFSPTLKGLYSAVREVTELRIAQRRYPISIHFDYINNGGFNALAFSTSEDLYHVGIFGALIPRLLDVFARVMSHPKILPQVGDPSIETTERIDSPPLDCLPKDTVRFRHSERFFIEAALFLIEHELGHIIKGHLRYIREKVGTVLYAEHDPSRVMSLTPLVSQALEYDADAMAAIGMFSHLKANIVGKQKFSMADSCETPFDSPQGEIHMWAF